jgi:hypothetical protein
MMIIRPERILILIPGWLLKLPKNQFPPCHKSRREAEFDQESHSLKAKTTNDISNILEKFHCSQP